MVHRNVVRDAIQPACKRVLTRLVPPQCFPRPEEHVLGQVFGFILIGDAKIDVAVNRVEMAEIQYAEGFITAARRHANQCLFVGLLWSVWVGWHDHTWQVATVYNGLAARMLQR